MNREHRTTTARRRARQIRDFERRINTSLVPQTSISIEARPASNAEEAGPSEIDGLPEHDDTGKNILSFLN